MRRLVYLVSASILALAVAIVPMPVLVLEPGLAASIPGGSDADPIVRIDGEVDEVTGDLLLTAVLVRSRPAFDTLRALLDDTREVVITRTVVPPGVDEEEFLEVQRRIFEESVRVAAAVGARAAGLDVTVGGNGARVDGIIPRSPAEDRLRPGDVVVAVDGEPIELASQLAARASQGQFGQRLELGVVRGDETLEITIQLGSVPGLATPGIGVLVRTLDLAIDLPFELEVGDRLRIGGPSAGLMLALTVYDLAEPGDLTRGRIVAGTGTIDLEGRVGGISGVPAKVEVARRAGATVFLVPATQLDQATRAAPPEMEVIPVATLEEAIAALESTVILRGRGPTSAGTRSAARPRGR